MQTHGGSNHWYKIKWPQNIIERIICTPTNKSSKQRAFVWIEYILIVVGNDILLLSFPGMLDRNSKDRFVTKLLALNDTCH